MRVYVHTYVCLLRLRTLPWKRSGCRCRWLWQCGVPRSPSWTRLWLKTQATATRLHTRIYHSCRLGPSPRTTANTLLFVSYNNNNKYRNNCCCCCCCWRWTWLSVESMCMTAKGPPPCWHCAGGSIQIELVEPVLDPTGNRRQRGLLNSLVFCFFHIFNWTSFTWVPREFPANPQPDPGVGKLLRFIEITFASEKVRQFNEKYLSLETEFHSFRQGALVSRTCQAWIQY